MGWKNRPPQDYAGGVFDKNEIPQDIFPARLTDVVDGLYTWNEVIGTAPDYTGWVDLTGGRSGDDETNPAYEPNDAAIDTDNEPIVFLMREYYDLDLDDVYVIVGTTGSGTPGSITVKESDGSPLCPSIDTIIVDANKMTVVCNGDGSATISVKTHSQTVVTDVVCNGDGTITVTTTNVDVVG